MGLGSGYKKPGGLSWVNDSLGIWRPSADEALAYLCFFVFLIVCRLFFNSFWEGVQTIAKQKGSYIVALRYCHDDAANKLLDRTKSQPKKFVKVGIRDLAAMIGVDRVPPMTKGYVDTVNKTSNPDSFRPTTWTKESMGSKESHAYYWERDQNGVVSLKLNQEAADYLPELFDIWIDICNKGGNNLIADLSDLSDKQVNEFLKLCQTKMIGGGVKIRLVEATRLGCLKPDSRTGKLKPLISLTDANVNLSAEQCANVIFKEMRRLNWVL